MGTCEKCGYQVSVNGRCLDCRHINKHPPKHTVEEVVYQNKEYTIILKNGGIQITNGNKHKWWTWEKFLEVVLKQQELNKQLGLLAHTYIRNEDDLI